MLTAEITGEEHPKTVTIVSDDADGENQRIIDELREIEWEDLAERFEAAPLDEAHLLKVTLEPEEVGEFIDFLGYGQFAGSDAARDLTAMRSEAVEAVEKKLAEG